MNDALRHVPLLGSGVDGGLQRQLRRERRARRQAESLARQLRRDALHDPLTGLANRTLLVDRMAVALARASRTSSYVGVLFLDLDRFKRINDTLGHASGDSLLRAVATRLREATRASDVVARLGGDEFVVVLDEVADHTELRLLGERIAAEIARPLVVDGHELVVRTSIGMRLAQSSDTADGILRDADAAMYEAKRLGSGHLLLFDTATRTLGWTPLEAEAELRQAMATGQVRPVYQPLINLEQGSLHAAECLARWTHPQHGPIPPTDFLTLAAETGMSAELDRLILRAAVLQAADWDLAAGHGAVVSVNLSAAALDDPALLDTVRSSLAETGVPSWALAVEFAERSLLAEGTWTARNLSALSSLGVQLIIDDFGTTYTTFGFLRRFPIDAVKIDLSYAGDIVSRPRDRAVLAGLRAMAGTLNMLAIAEGIETAEQVAVLRELGIRHGQGWHLGRPVTAADAGWARPGPHEPWLVD